MHMKERCFSVYPVHYITTNSVKLCYSEQTSPSLLSHSLRVSKSMGGNKVTIAVTHEQVCTSYTEFSELHLLCHFWQKSFSLKDPKIEPILQKIPTLIIQREIKYLKPDIQTSHVLILAVSYRITRNTALNTSLGFFSFKKQSRIDANGMKFLPATSFPNQGSNMQTLLCGTGDSILFPEGGRGSSVLIHR